MNLLRVNRLVNPTRLYISCEKSGGLHPVNLDLTAGNVAGCHTNLGKVRNFKKFAIDQNI